MSVVLTIAGMVLTGGLQLAPQPVNLDEIAAYQRDAFNRDITRCDELASHPDDPERVAEGIPQSAVDIDAGLTACHEAVEADPSNPRLNYQLARLYGYAGRHGEGDVYRDAALRAGYPQSLFVIGYIRITGWDGRPADPCYGGELVRRSAMAGRLAGLIGFPHYAVSGIFEACPPGLPVIDPAQMRAFLQAARSQTTDFYRLALIEQLDARLSEPAP